MAENFANKHGERNGHIQESKTQKNPEEESRETHAKTRDNYMAKAKTRRDSLKPRRKAAWDAEGTPQSSGDPSEQRGGCEQQPCRTGRTQCGQKAEETRPTKNSVLHSDSSEFRESVFQGNESEPPALQTTSTAVQQPETKDVIIKRKM